MHEFGGGELDTEKEESHTESCRQGFLMQMFECKGVIHLEVSLAGRKVWTAWQP